MVMHKYADNVGGEDMKKFIAMTLIMLMIVTLFAGCGQKAPGGTGVSSKAVKVIDIQLTQEEYAFGVDKNQPELLEEVNKFIAQIKADGTFDAILNKYFGGGTPEPVESAEPDSSKDQLVVATNAGFEPFEYTVGDKYLGIDMEIAKLLADHLGKELVISNMDFDAVCLSVGQSKADIAMAGLTIKEDRKEYVNFTDKYYDAAQKLIVMADDKTFDDAKTAEDVEAILSKFGSETKIGVQNGTTGQFYVEGDEDWGFTGFKTECIGYKSGSLAVQDMINGNISFVIIDEAPAESIAKAMNELN
jgi:ABC-type amino acid transport substrate-binding protein